MKGLKPKEFLLKHGEKIAFGFIVIAALFVLKSTRWSPYDRTPQELVKLSKEADLKIDQSEWPAEKRKELMPKKDIVARGQAMREGINTSDFAFSTPMYTPIYPKSEPITEPDFLTVEKLIATADVFLLQIPAEEEAGDGEDEADGDEPELDDSDRPDALKKKKKSTSSSELGADPAGAGFASPPGGEYADDGGAYPFGDDMMGGEGATQKVELNGEGYRFVSIRGVVDWQTQKAKYVDALNLPPDQAAFVEPDIVNFLIQRQRAVSQDDPWSGEWEDLDIQNSIDVLDKAYDFEADTVDVTITDSVITEPLPRRVLGIWGKHATHPSVTNFELSEEEIRRETLRQEKLIEAYEAIRKQSGQVEPIKEGGFSGQAYNVRSMQSELGMGSNSDYMADYENSYREESTNAYSENPEYYGASPGASPGEGGLLTTTRSKASGRLLLFRYFDFDVEPGVVYRYRVQLEFANPNFAKPIELLESPDVAEGQTKKSNWSEPTTAVQVRPKSEYFLSDVDFDRARRQDMASVNIYQWNAPTGTVVNETLRVAIGDRIAGQIKTRVVNPLDETYAAQDVVINSDHLLVDLLNNDTFELDSQLPDLGKVPTKAKYDEILVLDEQGQLEAISPYDREAKRIASQRFQKFQNELGKEYADAAKEASAAEKFLMGGEGEGEGEYGADGYGGGGEGSRPSSATSRRGKRSSSSP